MQLRPTSQDQTLRHVLCNSCSCSDGVPPIDSSSSHRWRLTWRPALMQRMGHWALAASCSSSITSCCPSPGRHWTAVHVSMARHGACFLACMCTRRGRRHAPVISRFIGYHCSCRAWLQILAQLVQAHAPDLDLERCLEAAGQVSPAAVTYVGICVPVCWQDARAWHLISWSGHVLTLPPPPWLVQHLQVDDTAVVMAAIHLASVCLQAAVSPTLRPSTTSTITTAAGPAGRIGTPLPVAGPLPAAGSAA